MFKKTVLVTGATGNVGRYVVSQLLNLGVPVRALGRSATVYCFTIARCFKMASFSAWAAAW